MSKRKSTLFRKNLPLLILRLLLGLAFAVSNVSMGQTSRRFYDEVIVSNTSEPLWSLGLFYLLALFSFLVFYSLQEILNVFIEEKSAEYLRCKAYSGYLHMSMVDMDRMKSGDLLTRLTSDVSQIRPLGGTLYFNILNSMILLGALLTWMFSVNRSLSLFLLPAPLLFCIGIAFFSTKMFMIAEKLQKYLAETNSLLSHAVKASHTIRLFFLRVAVRQQYSEKLAVLAKKAVEKDIAQTKMQNVWQLIMTPYQAAFYLWSGLMYLRTGTPSLGTIIAFSNFVSFLIYPMMLLLGGLSQIGQIMASKKRLASLLEEKEEDKKPLSDQSRATGDIVIQNVSYSYSEGKKALNRISCIIPGGKTTILWGPPGSGKSTLAKVILGLYQPDAGMIFWTDGNKTNSVETCHSHIAFLEQRPFIFAGSIKENLLLGAENCLPKKMENATAQAQIADRISMMPEGYNTALDERIPLSGGEKQRLALARCFMHDNDVFLLDEPTSAMNSELARDILNNLQKEYPNTTKIIITHDPALLCYADTVIQLKNGHITEISQNKTPLI